MGGGHPGCRMSKLLMNGLTALLHAEHGDAQWVNSVGPGWVRSAMGGRAPLAASRRAPSASSSARGSAQEGLQVASTGAGSASTGEAQGAGVGSRPTVCWKGPSQA